MALNGSGPISIAGTTAGQSIQIELGGNGTTQMSLNDAAVRTLAGVPSGAITMPTNFYGKANQFSFSIASNQTNANLRTLAVNAGWNQSSKVVATINSGVIVSANSTGTPGLVINGSFPGGVDLINNGTIAGMGGAGGAGASWFKPYKENVINADPGSSGGLALSVSTAVTITNNGIIGGGGGGGGGGGSDTAFIGGVRRYYGGGGGGGGRTGATNSAGASGKPNGSPPVANFFIGGTGAAGTSSSGGAGGPGGSAAGASGGAGGAGGAYGSAGGTGGATGQGGQAVGGAGGAAITGNSNITWISFGTRSGAIS
jgi:hypothetical protein